METGNPSAFFSNFNNFIETIPQVLFALDISQDKFLYLSPAYETVFEAPLTDTPEKFSSWLKAVHPDDQETLLEFFRSLTTEAHQEMEFRSIAPGGNNRWLKIQAIAVTGKQGDAYITGIMKDISSQRDYRATLQHFADRKNSILQILAHDLMGPLGNIQLSVSLLSGQDTTDTASLNGLLDVIAKNCRRDTMLIQNLVNEEFLTTSKSDLLYQRVDMVAKLQVIVNEFRESSIVLTQHFEFICELDKLYANIDEAKFNQVIINLLSNAIKFTKEDGNIRLRLYEAEGEMHIDIQDDGIGIPADLQPYLFEKFGKAGRPGLRGEPSIGLGMSIIKTIVEWHQGRISFESSEGKGTTFYISLPLVL